LAPHGSFSKDEPNLSSDFNMKGLRPIVRQKDGDTFILQDLRGIYYLWDPCDSHLLKVVEKWTIGGGLNEVEDVVRNIIGHFYWVREEATKVFRRYHQATEGEPPEEEARYIKPKPL
jgi:hypothetical protein